MLYLVLLHSVPKQNRALHYQAIAITFDHVPYGHPAAATPTVWPLLQEEFAGCCSQACLEAPRLLRPPKQAGYYGNWTTYRYQLVAVSVVRLDNGNSLSPSLAHCGTHAWTFSLSYFKVHRFYIQMHPNVPSRHVIEHRQAAVQAHSALPCIQWVLKQKLSQTVLSCSITVWSYCEVARQ